MAYSYVERKRQDQERQLRIGAHEAGFAWQDPPVIKRGRPRQPTPRVQRICAALRANPGRWALVEKGVKSGASNKTWKRQGMQTRVHKRVDDLWDIYARFPEED